MFELLKKHQAWVLFFSVLAGLLILGIVYQVWEGVLTILGFGVGAPALLRRQVQAEQSQADAISAAEKKAEKTIAEVVAEEKREQEATAKLTTEERKKRLLRGIDDV